MTTGIYKIQNLVDSKVYIGASIHIEERFNQHLNELRKGIHANSYLQRAFNKYGESNFEFSIVEECEREDLQSAEIRILHGYGGYKSETTYNLREAGRVCSGEDNPNFGKHWSEDWRKQQSDRMKIRFSDPANHPMYGKHHSPETIEKISQSHTGVPQSQESNLKRSATLKSQNRTGPNNPMYGKHHSEETKAKLRQSSQMRKHTPEELEKMRIAATGRKHTSETIAKFKQQRQQYVWEYEGVEFSCSEDLAEYLRKNGYPKIAGSTVTNLYNRGFYTSKTYAGLEGKISRTPIRNR